MRLKIILSIITVLSVMIFLGFHEKTGKSEIKEKTIKDNVSASVSYNTTDKKNQPPILTFRDKEVLGLIGDILSNSSISRKEKIKKLLDIFNRHESLIINEAAMDGIGVLSPIEVTNDLLNILKDFNIPDSTKAKVITALYNAYIIPWDIESSFSTSEITQTTEAKSEISKVFTDLLMSGRSGSVVNNALLYSYGVTNSLEDNAKIFQKINDGVIEKSEAAVQFEVTSTLDSKEKINTFLPLLLADNNKLDQILITTEISKNIVNEVGYQNLSNGDKKTIFTYLSNHQPTVSDEIPDSSADYAYWQLAKQMMVASSKQEALATLSARAAS